MNPKWILGHRIMKTMAEVLWDDLKDQSIELFCLPGQTVSKYFTPRLIPGVDILYLKTDCPVAIPALEEVVKKMGPEYLLDIGEEYITLMINSAKEKKLEPVLRFKNENGVIMMDTDNSKDAPPPQNSALPSVPVAENCGGCIVIKGE